MSIVIAKIDTSGPTGRRILRNLKNHPKVAKLEYPIPEELEGEKLYTVQEAFADLRERVEQHYSKK
ncbi:MAG: hypothetical protein Q4G63_00370 [Bacteroidia bacterium]|nr:hypothetical protein [Bacteroidia bacterium]